MWLRRSQEASVTRLAGALLRGLHLAASLKARARLVIQLHSLQKASLSRSCLCHLSHLLTLIKVTTELATDVQCIMEHSRKRLCV